MKLVVPLSVFVVVYVVYYLTAFSSVTGGDSGELLAEACQLGTAHPPGYPLFTILAHVVTLVPVPRLLIDTTTASFFTSATSSVAWRVNNFCCVLGGIAAALLCSTGIAILNACGLQYGIILSAIGSLAYAFTPLIWEYSITAEVFALNNALCALLLHVLCATLIACQNLKRDHNRNSIFVLSALGGLCCGLVLANQHSSLLMVAYVVPCVLASVWLYAPSLILSVLFRSGLGFLLGFSTYAYLPWASSVPTPGSWGNLTTLEGFTRHILRAEYGTFRLGMIVGSETALERIAIYMVHTSGESFHLLFVVLCTAALAIFSLIALKRTSSPIAKGPSDTSKKSKAAAAKSKAGLVQTSSQEAKVDWSPAAVLIGNLVAMWLFYVLVWHCVLSNLPLSSPMPFAVHSRFWMQPNIILYTLMTVAIGYLCECVSSKATLFRTVVVQTALVTVYVSAVLHQRWSEMDKSSGGDVLHSYASAKLASILPPHTSNSAVLASQPPPLHSLLLSHTDLDWNPVRYLQHCEGVGMDASAVAAKSPFRQWFPTQGPLVQQQGLVTHLSFQLIPYPWFRSAQAPLYPHVVFPPTNFEGVSADRASEGNAQLILRFLHANGIRNESFLPSKSKSRSFSMLRSTHTTFTGGVYLDMQAVHEAEIETFGHWRGLVLVPWGTLYRVFGALSLGQIQELHHYSLWHLRRLQEQFPVVDDKFVLKFAAGSWERAAANVFYDAHYQFGLNLLTYSMEAQGKIEMKILPLLLDRYFQAASVLLHTSLAVQKYNTFSSSVADLSKNTALAWMRLLALMDAVGQFRSEIKQQIDKLTDRSTLDQKLLDKEAVLRLLDPGARIDLAASAKVAIGAFLRDYPGDKDTGVFAGVYAKL